MKSLPMSLDRLHRLEHITLGTLRTLDRDHTVVLLPVGMIEEHGDHLPMGTDNFAVEALTLTVVAWLLENDPQLHVLLLPTIPYGTDPVDLRRKELFERAGSVWISRETLKRIVSEVVGHVLRYGFRYVFPIGFHGGPGQSLALAEVCAEMREQHPGLVMYEPIGYVMAGAERFMTPGLETLLGRPLTPAEQVALKGSVHASMFETSMMLHLRPDLVKPLYRRLRTIEWNQLYQMPDWPGYVGSGPAHADAGIGGAVLRWRGVRAGSLILRALNGEDLSELPRHPAWSNPPEDEAAAVTEAPGEDELPPPGEPYIDTKPAMYISGEELADALERAKREQDADLSDPAEAPSSDSSEES